ncbi:hypothetical protein PPL_07474 [Heterostelium album PN500]|uniref:Uncharacterized protein n=1 Tax=Heterostelium pallidum (strain ATCC 26659 / Pp 5 / PN500) TaxID=670386 RepID=D3BG23_HETP5|nr:hypothetical protein PPL_07474 [Heterostelium album PN500]EFA79615.1 hypothetical protein PPL_07474 [Heterostelium album PN500]|eukprot:XP_020431736.1 hypothetical protein PPL_07474 [Heterostelium album PN500]
MLFAVYSFCKVGGDIKIYAEVELSFLYVANNYNNSCISDQEPIEEYPITIERSKDDYPINVEGIDFNDQNSLINFNRIYNLYYECLENGNDSLRSQCVKFFVDYHEYKFIHSIDIQGYIKFIVDVFFDPEFDVFRKMSSFYCGSHKPTIQQIYNRIINDKRVIINKLIN